MASTSRSRSLALGASIASFLFTATVAAAPGSPFTPILPEGAGSSGPFRWLAGFVGLDAVHGSALAAIGVVAVAGAAATFAFVALAAWRGMLDPRTVLWLALAYHAALVLLPLLFSRDVYSYGAYGRIAAIRHANPYVATPADFPGDPFAPFVGPKWFDTPSVYGPLWIQISAIVVRLVDSVGAAIVAFRLIAIGASLATVVVVARLVRRVHPAREAFAIAVLGLNPVVVFQSAASGHNDLLVALSVASAAALAFGRRDLLATAALALGTLIKATAAVPLLLWVVVAVARRPAGERARALGAHLGVAGGLGLVAALPFLNTSDPSLGMLELAGHEGWLAPSRFFRRVFDAVSGHTLGVVPRVVFPIVLLGGLVLLVRALLRRLPATPGLASASWGWGLLLLMLLGPVLLPWYVTWSLPLVWLLPRVPRLVALGTGLTLTVSQWTSEPARFATAYDVNVLFGHYVLTPVVIALLAWLLVDLRRRSAAGSTLEDEPDQEPAAAGER